MIFMSESGINDAARQARRDEWYIAHLKIMLSVPGVDSAQRFHTAQPGHPPSLALYTIQSRAVFADAYYQSVRGMGEWLPLIDRRFYRRNLFEGLAEAPAVSNGECLIVADRSYAQPQLHGIAVTWLEAAGLDQSTPFRGIAVVDAATARRLSADAPDIAIYRPVTERLSK